MSGALTTRGESSRTQAVQRFTGQLQELGSRSLLTRTLLSNIAGRAQTGLQKKSPNIVRITLDQSAVSPGDQVSGTIKLMLSKAVTVHRLTVQLLGESKSTSFRINPTHGGGHIRYNSYFKLVDEITEIDLEEKTLTPKIYNFPFQITLPRTYTIRESEWPYDEKTERFNSNLTQNVPGSFKGRSDQTADAYCSIEYFVIAKLTPEEGKRYIKHQIPISVVIKDTRSLTGGESFNSSFQNCTFDFKLGKSAQAGLVPPATETETETGLTRRQSGFKEKLQEGISRFRSTAYHFDLEAKIPRFGRIAEPLDISLKLFWHQQGSTPIVSLKAMRVELQSQCMFRGTTKDKINDMSWQLVDQTMSYHVLWISNSLVISELKDPVLALQPEEDLRMGRLMFVHPRSILSAFKTCNIAREYRLCVICELECAGKSFTAKYIVNKFNVIAGEGIVDDDFWENRPSRHDVDEATEIDEEEEEEEDWEREDQDTLFEGSVANGAGRT